MKLNNDVWTKTKKQHKKKNKKQIKEKHEQQKNRNKIKLANCTEIHKTDVKQKPQNKKPAEGK